MSGADAVEQALLDAAQLEPENDVLVLGGGALVFGAHERVGDGWIYVVREHVDELEELLGKAHAAGASGVAYLVGEALVLPLPDAAVAAALGRVVLEDGELPVVMAELARVVSEGGRVALAEPGGAEAYAVGEALTSVGFEAVERTAVGDEVVVSGRRG